VTRTDVEKIAALAELAVDETAAAARGFLRTFFGDQRRP